MTPSNPNLDHANMMRSELELAEKSTRDRIEIMKRDGVLWEVIAQATLALRHIEDARMRYGKVIQYLGDGTSIYNKPQTLQKAEDTSGPWKEVPLEKEVDPSQQ